MKTLLLLLPCTLCTTLLLSQNTSSVTVKAGSRITDVLSPAEMYCLPQFTAGKVFFKDGIIAEARMNYNEVLDEMHFIDGKGDTLALADEKNIRLIATDKDTFYYNEGYLRLLMGGNIVKLAIKVFWKGGDVKKQGGYNTLSAVSAVSSKNTYFGGGRIHRIAVNEDVVFSKKQQYYFGDRNNRFVLAGKKNLLRLFPKEQGRIQAILQQGTTDFNNRNDLEKIVQFLEQQ